MPSAGGFGVDVGHDSVPGVVLRLNAIKTQAPRWGRETVQRASKIGAEVMRSQAPESKEGTGSEFPYNASVAWTSLRLGNLRQPLKDRIGSDTPVYFPGGAGGGGTWHGGFGVEELAGVPEDQDPASFVFHGTGRRGDDKASGHNITSSTPGNLLTFMEGGKQVWTRSVGGQRPKTGWVLKARAAAKGEVRRRIVELGRDL